MNVSLPAGRWLARVAVLGAALSASGGVLGGEGSPLRVVNDVPEIETRGGICSHLLFSGSPFSLGLPVTVTDSWTPISYSVTAPIDDNDAMVQINLGSAIGRITLRNFELVRERDGQREVLEQQPLTGASLPAGWSFVVAPKAQAQCRPGAKGVEVAVTHRTDFAWDVQLARPHLSLMAGARYTIRFEARSDGPAWPLTSYLMRSEPLRFYAGQDPKDRFGESTALASAQGANLLALLIPRMPWSENEAEYATEMALIHAAIGRTLRQFPDTDLIIRFGVEPSAPWRKAHPTEMLAWESGRTGRYVCVTSPVWLAEVGRRVPRFVRDLEEKWGERIVGYAPAAQSTGEWYYPIWDPANGEAMNFSSSFLRAYRAYLQEKYDTVEALNRTWKTKLTSFAEVRVPTTAQRARAELGPFRNPATQRELLDFTEYQQVAMVRAMEAVAAAVKSGRGGDKLVLMFYGYTFELAGCQNGIGETGHLGLGRVLRSAQIDGVIDLISYGDRGVGGTGMLMCPTESITAHGKLPFTEDDSRTHLSAPNAGYERTLDTEQTTWALSRNLLRTLAHNGYQWKFDLYGQGWFGEPASWTVLGQLAGAYARQAPEPYRAEVAVVVDEKSLLALRPGVELTKPLLSDNRREFARTGLGDPSWWLLDDVVEGRVPPHKLTVFLNAFWLDAAQRDAIRGYCRRSGGTVLWLYAPGFLDADGESLRAMEELTGFRFRPREGHPAGAHTTDPRGVLTGLKPEQLPAFPPEVDTYFAVEPAKEVQALAFFPGEEGAPAVASRDEDGFRSVFCAAPALSAAFLVRLAVDAGIRPIAPVGTIVLHHGNLLGVTSPRGGDVPLSLPGTFTVCALDGTELHPPTDRLVESFRQGETRIFTLNPAQSTAEAGKTQP